MEQISVPGNGQSPGAEQVRPPAEIGMNQALAATQLARPESASVKSHKSPTDLSVDEGMKDKMEELLS